MSLIDFRYALDITFPAPAKIGPKVFDFIGIFLAIFNCLYLS